MEVKEITCNPDVIVKNVQLLLNTFLEKFSNKTLVEEDFNINVFETVCVAQSEENDLDKKVPVDYELEFENGEVKVTSPTRKSLSYYDSNYTDERKKKTESIIREEKLLRDRMKQLMTTFEEETRNLDRKINFERELIKKKYETEYNIKLKDEQVYLNGIINDLIRRLELIEQEREEIISNYEEEKKDIETFYMQRLTEDRKRFQLEMQTKLLHAHKEWQKTKI